MSIENKISKGEWWAEGHHVLIEGQIGCIGQSYASQISSNETKLKQDAEGEANAKLFAASKDMYKALKKVEQDLLNSGCGPNEWMHRRMMEIRVVFEKHNL
jgi:hypothetical protein